MLLWRIALENDCEEDAREIVQTSIDEAVRNRYVDVWESLAHEQRSQKFPFEILFVDDNPGLIECRAGMIRRLESLCNLESLSDEEEEDEEEEEESTFEHAVSLWLKSVEAGLRDKALQICVNVLADALRAKCFTLDQANAHDEATSFPFSLLFPDEDDDMRCFNFQAELVTRFQDLLESGGALQKKDFNEHQLDKQFPGTEKFTRFCRSQVQKGILIDSHEQWLVAFREHLMRKVLKHARDGSDSLVDALEKLITESDVSQPSVYEEYAQKLKALKEESPSKRIRL